MKIKKKTSPQIDSEESFFMFWVLCQIKSNEFAKQILNSNQIKKMSNKLKYLKYLEDKIKIQDDLLKFHNDYLENLKLFSGNREALEIKRYIQLIHNTKNVKHILVVAREKFKEIYENEN